MKILAFGNCQAMILREMYGPLRTGFLAKRAKEAGAQIDPKRVRKNRSRWTSLGAGVTSVGTFRFVHHGEPAETFRKFHGPFRKLRRSVALKKAIFQDIEH